MRPRSWLGGGSSSPKRRLKASRSIVVELLVAQQDHRMLVPGALDGAEVRLAEPLEVDAQYLDADGVAERPHRHCHRFLR